ncbi:PIN2/TERF1-interacting telomerase inhibitor 1 [Saitoella coloradoensis]
MGLAGPRNKQRIGEDPRNTRWGNDTNKFGFKLMSNMGWSSGDGLGKNRHGRSINIKVTAKDNTLGLGAKQGAVNDWTGLSAFNDMFKRLNGVDVQEKEKHKKKMGDLKVGEVYVLGGGGLKNYLGSGMRFVKGETYTTEMSKENFAKRGLATTAEEAAAAEASSSSSSSSSSAEEEEEVDTPEPAPKKRKRSASIASASSSSSSDEKPAKSRKSKKSKTKTSSDPSKALKKALKATRKAEKAAKKEAKAAKKAAKKEGKTAGTVVTGHRLAHRAKFMRQKKAAFGDADRMAEILGIKA